MRMRQGTGTKSIEKRTLETDVFRSCCTQYFTPRLITIFVGGFCFSPIFFCTNGSTCILSNATIKNSSSKLPTKASCRVQLKAIIILCSHIDCTWRIAVTQFLKCIQTNRQMVERRIQHLFISFAPLRCCALPTGANRNTHGSNGASG